VACASAVVGSASQGRGALAECTEVAIFEGAHHAVSGVVVKNGSNTDLIKCLPCAIRVLPCNCSGRAVSGMKTHP
jgi:hypothetical protein